MIIRSTECSVLTIKSTVLFSLFYSHILLLWLKCKWDNLEKNPRQNLITLQNNVTKKLCNVENDKTQPNNSIC